MKLVYIILLVLIPGFQCHAQLPEADTLAKNGNHQAAVKRYLKHLKQNENDSSAWFSLGQSYHALEKYDQAVSAYKKAIETNFYKAYTYLYIAKSHALNKNKSAMYAALDSGFAAGASSAVNLENDDEFNVYREEERFQSLIKALKTRAYPCLAKERANQFDFWVGEWTVYAGGRQAGKSQITKAKGGCAIHESYTTAREYAGQSINFLDPKDNLWKQYWVGSQGDIRDYVEIDAGEGMLQFLAEYDNQGSPNLSKMTFTYDKDKDTVRQLFENSTDNGQTWTVVFDGLYVRE